MAFRLATLFVDIVTNQGNFDASMQSMRGALGPMISMTQRMADAGSTLFETMNKIDVTFGKSRGTVVAMANEMATRFGTVKNVALDAAANVGLIGQAAGMTEEQSAHLAVQMTKLADDASSFFNVPMDVALEKIRSGLVGQARPLREFGVLLSKSAVDHELMRMGIQKVHGEFTEQEKVMARVEIITRSLAKAQGDHERTMGSYVNQQRKLRGEMENFTTGIGAGVAGAEAQFMVNVRDKGIIGGIGSHIGSVFAQLFGNKDTAFQGGADVAAGLEIGLKGIGDETAKPKAIKISTAADYATEAIIAEWQEEMKEIEEINSYKKYVADNAREMEKIQIFAEYASFDTKSPKQYAKEAKEKKALVDAEEDANEFMEDFFKQEDEKAKGYHRNIHSMGAAEFASKLRMEQGGVDIPKQQLTELQQLRKQEAESTKTIVDAMNKGQFAVLG